MVIILSLVDNVPDILRLQTITMPGVQNAFSKCLTRFFSGKAEGSLYVGLGGMAYSLWHIAKSGILPEHNSRLLQTAKMYMEIALGKIFLKHVDAFDEVAFLLGNVGNYLAAAFIYESLGEKEKLRGWNELFLAS